MEDQRRYSRNTSQESGMELQGRNDSRPRSETKSSTGVDELRDAMKNSSALTAISANLTLVEGGHSADGCVVLGSDGQSLRERYTTRFRIDHHQSQSGMGKAILEEECTPCCGEEGKENPKMCFWLFVKSEAFLFSLHMISLALGVAKEAMDYRLNLQEDLELVHSLLETFVAILMISIRMVSGWISYRDLKENAFKCEYIDATNKITVRGRALKRGRNFFLAVGAALIVLAIICFLLFKYLAHLGWTILSNNFCMIVFTVVSGLFSARVTNARTNIEEDQKSAVFAEALLLLHENVIAHERPPEPPEVFDTKRTHHFLRAVEETHFLEKPVHITAPPHVKTEEMFSMWRAMDLQNMV